MSRGGAQLGQKERFFEEFGVRIRKGCPSAGKPEEELFKGFPECVSYLCSHVSLRIHLPHRGPLNQRNVIPLKLAFSEPDKYGPIAGSAGESVANSHAILNDGLIYTLQQIGSRVHRPDRTLDT